MFELTRIPLLSILLGQWSHVLVPAYQFGPSFMIQLIEETKGSPTSPYNALMVFAMHSWLVVCYANL